MNRVEYNRIEKNRKIARLFTSIFRVTASHNVYLTENSSKLKTVYKFKKLSAVLDKSESLKTKNIFAKVCKILYACDCLVAKTGAGKSRDTAPLLFLKV